MNKKINKVLFSFICFQVLFIILFYFIYNDKTWIIKNWNSVIKNWNSVTKKNWTWSEKAFSNDDIIKNVKLHYKDIDFNIKKYDKNWLSQDLYNECSGFIKNSPNLTEFFNTELKEFNIDFSKNLSCTNNDTSTICNKLNTYKKWDRITLNDVANMLYGIYYWNFTYEKYLEVISTDKINFPNLIPDLTYSKYYWLVVSWKIKNIDDCINNIYGKWNIQ